MEKKINKKISDYVSTFKNDIKEKANSLGNANSEENLQLLQYIYDYVRLVVSKEDFQKRKRVKNVVPSSCRCLALRSCSEQCSRRRSSTSDFCGTHNKGVPHGVISSSEITSYTSNTNTNTNSNPENDNTNTHKIEVCAHDINGIMYYLDNQNNIYNPEEIQMNTYNPAKIGTYNQIGEKYNIQLF